MTWEEFIVMPPGEFAAELREKINEAINDEFGAGPVGQPAGASTGI